MHPLMPDPKELSDTDLTDKISKVLDRMTFATQLGHSDTFQQLNNIYQDLLMEQQNRIANSYVNDDDEDPFEGLINIKKK